MNQPTSPAVDARESCVRRGPHRNRSVQPIWNVVGCQVSLDTTLSLPTSHRAPSPFLPRVCPHLSYAIESAGSIPDYPRKSAEFKRRNPTVSPKTTSGRWAPDSESMRRSCERKKRQGKRRTWLTEHSVVMDEWVTKRARQSMRGC